MISSHRSKKDITDSQKKKKKSEVFNMKVAQAKTELVKEGNFRIIDGQNFESIHTVTKETDGPTKKTTTRKTVTKEMFLVWVT